MVLITENRRIPTPVPTEYRMRKLLVVDDEPSVLKLFRGVFTKREVEVVTAQTAAEAIKLLSAENPHVAVFDVMLPDRSGLELMQEARQLDTRLPVLFVTGDTASETAIEAMRLGAFDHLVKPLDVEQLVLLVDRAFRVRELMNEPIEVGDAESGDTEPALQDSTSAPHQSSGMRRDALVGTSPAMQTVYKAIGRVAPQNVTVLIRGESGTGKELVARALYQYSNRSERPFLAVNCAAIPESLLESELFGHEKGAFTSADRRRIGKFEQCDGGTLFLDEIGDMPLVLQSKILRLLQEQRFERVGGNDLIETDVRIIAATNRDLESMAEEGRFRWDLYYRLNVYTIHLPAMRARREDLPLLVDHFLRKANIELQKDVRRVAPEALQELRDYSWPGNVRELQSVLKQAVLATTGNVVLAEFLPDSVRQGPRMPAGRDFVSECGTWPGWQDFVDQRIAEGNRNLYSEAVALTEKQIITRTLQHADGNQVQAAEILGINRGTLRTKLKQLGISIEQVVETGKD